MQGSQYATKRSILCRGAFCGSTVHSQPPPISLNLYLIETPFNTFVSRVDPDQAALVRAG